MRKSMLLAMLLLAVILKLYAEITGKKPQKQKLYKQVIINYFGL